MIFIPWFFFWRHFLCPPSMAPNLSIKGITHHRLPQLPRLNGLGLELEPYGTFAVRDVFPKKNKVSQTKKLTSPLWLLFFILENKPKILQIFVFLVFGLSYIIQTIGNTQTFLLFGFPKKILPLLRPIACRSLQCPCGRRASKARKT